MNLPLIKIGKLSVALAAVALCSIIVAPSALALSLTDPITAGSLIRCPEFSSVYYFGSDGKRYVFQNEKAFFSHITDFSDVVDVSCEDMAQTTIGGIVPYEAGTRLIKVPSAREVYAVEPNGVLREIQSEAQAIELYGTDWAEKVDDLNEAFFPQYTVAAPLGDNELPTGMVIQNDEGEFFRIDQDGKAVSVDNTLDLYDTTHPDAPTHPLVEHAVPFSRLESQFADLDFIDSNDSDYQSRRDILDEQTYFRYIAPEEQINDVPIFSPFVPVDTDGDLIPDHEERMIGTDPNNPDTDGDGFSDGVEVLNGFNPNGPGLLGEEPDETTDPVQESETVPEAEEPVEEQENEPTEEAEQDPVEETEPDETPEEPEQEPEELPELGGVNDDADGDELSDEAEQQLGTDPFNPDTDDDGLSDGDEIDNLTDPFDPDSDNDGILDGKEVEAGTDPNSP